MKFPDKKLSNLMQKKLRILNTLPNGGGWHVRLLDINYHAGKKRILNSLTVGTIQYDNSI